jgi:ABC-type lipoprotein export system ATPase subunit
MAVDRLRQFGQDRRLQFLLITHEARLANVCDSVIDVTKLGA